MSRFVHNERTEDSRYVIQVVLLQMISGLNEKEKKTGYLTWTPWKYDFILIFWSQDLILEVKINFFLLTQKKSFFLRAIYVQS